MFDNLDEALNALDCARSEGWFHPPLTPEEIDRHPDRDRLLATIEAVFGAGVRLALGCRAENTRGAFIDEGLRIVR